MLSEVEASHSCKRFFVVSLLRMTILFLVLRYFIVSNEYFGLNKWIDFFVYNKEIISEKITKRI